MTYEVVPCPSMNHHEIRGPGLGYHGSYLAIHVDKDTADTIARMLAKAFAAGGDARAAEIRRALGVVSR